MTEFLSDTCGTFPILDTDMTCHPCKLTTSGILFFKHMVRIIHVSLDHITMQTNCIIFFFQILAYISKCTPTREQPHHVALSYGPWNYLFM